MRFRSDGQLALLDAVVFFAVCVVVSSMLLSYGASSSDDFLGPSSGGSNPEQILRAFLGACIGTKIALLADSNYTIQEHDEVSTCLAMEIEAIIEGFDSGLFDDLDDAYMRILRRITNPIYDPWLVVLETGGGGHDALLSLPRSPEVAGAVLASSELLPCGEKACLVEVLLSTQSLT